MKNTSGVSLIVSTYNWPAALNLCLLSIQKQVLLPDEVIIADDGSGEETRLLIEKFINEFPVPLIHVWQPDEGFQLSRIRNKAIARASQGYIVQIDGDLILERHFIQDHVAFRKEGSFVSGTRVQMSSKLTARVIENALTDISVFSKGITNTSNAIRVPILSKFLESRYKRSDPAYVRGCNMAFWRKDLITVNGYNERIVGWGREDSELAIRLINAGVAKRIYKFGAVVFHLYHKETKRAQFDINQSILEQAISNKTTSCEHGLDQYLTVNKLYI
jgi:glycosyltransferase involved in cell wall biosynthesis